MPAFRSKSVAVSEGREHSRGCRSKVSELAQKIVDASSPDRSRKPNGRRRERLFFAALEDDRIRGTQSVSSPWIKARRVAQAEGIRPFARVEPAIGSPSRSDSRTTGVRKGLRECAEIESHLGVALRAACS
jgi:hypothetical protein